MAILLTCSCGRKLKIKEEFAGQEGQCPACGATLTIPFPDQVPEVALAEPAPVNALPESEPEQRSHQEVRRVPARRDERTEKIANHGGGDLPVNGDYFVEAPAEIGALASAYTTLRKGQRPWSIAARTVVCVLATIGGLVLGAGIDLVFDLAGSFWFIVWPIVFPAGAFLLALYLTSFTHTVTYVGEEGVARYCCSGTRDNVTTNEVFLFRDATHLRTSTTHHYNRGSYQYTSYKYTWSDVGGRQRYEISGTHNSRQSTPPATHAFHFARAAELAWTMYLLEQANRQVDLAGGVSFPLKGRQSIRICPGRIIFNLKDEDPVEWEAEEVGDAVIQQGAVKIKRVDAQEGWFSSTGVVKFPFDQLANAQLFFHLLEKLIGVEVR
jgi:hypothetical protein